MILGEESGSVVFDDGIHLKLTSNMLHILKPYKFDEQFRVTSHNACYKHWAHEDILSEKFLDVVSVCFIYIYIYILPVSYSLYRSTFMEHGIKTC